MTTTVRTLGEKSERTRQLLCLVRPPPDEMCEPDDNVLKSLLWVSIFIVFGFRLSNVWIILRHFFTYSLIRIGTALISSLFRARETPTTAHV
jgi:hypothetical protein